MVSILGTLFHFAYDFIPIFFFPKNESIFEHTKLILFPFLIYGFSSLPFIKESRREYFASFISAIFISILFTIVSYYTYSGFIGSNIDVVNIILYYVSVLIGFYFIYKKKILMSFYNSIIYLIILLVLVIVFTYYPPELAFFNV